MKQRPLPLPDDYGQCPRCLKDFPLRELHEDDLLCGPCEEAWVEEYTEVLDDPR